MVELRRRLFAKHFPNSVERNLARGSRSSSRAPTMVFILPRSERDPGPADHKRIAAMLENDVSELVPPKWAAPLNQRGGNEDRGRNSEMLEQRGCDLGGAAIAIVKRDRDGVPCKGAFGMSCGE